MFIEDEDIDNHEFIMPRRLQPIPPPEQQRLPQNPALDEFFRSYSGPIIQSSTGKVISFIVHIAISHNMDDEDDDVPIVDADQVGDIFGEGSEDDISEDNKEDEESDIEV